MTGVQTCALPISFLRAKAYRVRVGGVSPDTPFLRAKAYRARVGGSPRCGIEQIRAGGM